MTRQIIISVLIQTVFIGMGSADTFRHRQTGETFTGFVTQKQNQGRTLVYNDTEKTFTPVKLAEYEVTRDQNGRRNSIMFIPISHGEAIVSREVAQATADAIVEASNGGHRYIVLEIDNPGGRGDYMKIITSAITNTTNCPVIAFISGGQFGGAYSAAVPIALACEKIYMAGDAVMGAIAPMVGRNPTPEAIAEYNQLFASDMMVSFASHAGNLAANRGRPAAVAMALLDKSIAIIEVEDPDKNRTFINKAELKPQQTVIRTISRVETEIITEQDAAGKVTTREITRHVLTLQAADAVGAGLAEKVVGSRDHLLTELASSDAQIAYTRTMESIIRRFVAAKRNLQGTIAQIGFLEHRVSQLKARLDYADELVGTSPTVIEQRRYTPLPGGYYGGPSDSRWREGRFPGRSDTIVIQKPSPEQINMLNELSVLLADLISAYGRLVVPMRRDPGILPPSMTPESLQRSHDSAILMRENIMARIRMIPPAVP